MYYRMMGWDEETGVPTRGKLEELGIGWVAEDLKLVNYNISARNNLTSKDAS
ncbi:hypothetical protein CW705_09760 [Candidatus Bathyarchaeota archaeon]|nr:MAG: hypothetical protein CW705_09760 [Candidatus Bathyarchaeota archaeon]